MQPSPKLLNRILRYCTLTVLRYVLLNNVQLKMTIMLHSTTNGINSRPDELSHHTPAALLNPAKLLVFEFSSLSNWTLLLDWYKSEVELMLNRNKDVAKMTIKTADLLETGLKALFGPPVGYLGIIEDLQKCLLVHMGKLISCKFNMFWKND